MRQRDLHKLAADPKRQAMPTLEGFSYQVWQSVYRWIRLREDQALILEGAEDLDLIGPGYAQPIQVTNASRRVSLQSRKIIDAISHFWQHQINNRERLISFRFLTTAERGYERSKPFGTSTGLDYWDSCRFPGVDLTPLRSFLCAKSSLPTQLRKFMSIALDEEIRSRLIERIEWDTGSKPLPVIKELIREQLANYGNRVHDFPPADSVKVLPHLLERAWDVIINRDDRSLTYHDFMLLFQEVTAELIGKSELRYLRRVDRRTRQATHYGSLVGGTLTSTVLEELSQAVNDRLVQRLELVTNLRTQLNNTALLVLTGSSGMGKSTLANEIASTDESKWRRLDMRARPPEQVLERLEYAISVLETVEEPNFIIDDLNFDTRPDLYEKALTNVISMVRLNFGRIILTTQGELPTSVVNLCDISNKSRVTVQALTEAEIKVLVSNYGCPQGKKLEGWGRLIFLKTRGHPLLAHAYVKRLTARRWPAYTRQDLGPTQDLSDVRREVRRRLKEQLPSEEARQLSYRLSVMTGAFKRDHALYMGQHSPAIRATGEAFDMIVGPWVEQVNENYFRLSPLLGDSATELFTKKEIVALHESAANAFLSTGTISPTELSATLFHGMLGESRDALGKAVIATFQVPEKHWSDVSRSLDWFGFWRMGPDELLFSSDFVLNSLLRRLQFKVVAETNPERAVNIAAIIEKELELWEKDSPPGQTVAMECAYLFDVIFDLHVPFSITTTVRNAGKLLRFLQTYSLKLLDEKWTQPEVLNSTLKQLATPTVLVRSLISRCKGANDVMEFLSAVEDQPADVSEKVWDVLGEDIDAATTLVDRIWLSEARVTTPDWHRCIDVLDEIAVGAIAKKRDSLIAAAYRAKAIVLEEYLKDLDAALKTISEGEQVLGSRNTTLEDYRARALSLENQHAQALEIWSEILPTVKDKEVSLLVFSFRDAEMCAAKLGNWKQAGELALAGESATRRAFTQYFPEAADLSPLADLRVGYRADYAFALWKSGNRLDAVKEFASVLSEFDTLPDPAANVKINMLYQRVGHAITWINAVSRDLGTFVEPAPGFFSNQEIIDQIKEREVYPRVFLWYLLAKLEHRFKLGDDVFQRFKRELQNSSKAALRSSFIDLQIGFKELLVGHSLRTLELDGLVSQFMDSLKALKTYAEGKQSFESSDELELIGLLLSAIIRAHEKNLQASVPIDRWRKEAAAYESLGHVLADWLDFVETSMKTNPLQLLKFLRDESLPEEMRVVASLFISGSDEPNSEDRFVANIVLTLTNLYVSWLPDAEEFIEAIVCQGWMHVAQTEQFSLCSPSLNSAKIIAACEDNSCAGIRKAARVLLAAKESVRSRIGAKLQDLLMKRAA